MIRFYLILISISVGFEIANRNVNANQHSKVDFEKEIAPLLIKRCLDCHNDSEKSGGLDLSSSKGLKAGGDSSEDLLDQVIDSNFLLERVFSGEMPPPEKGESKELNQEEKSLLKQWIQQGAAWPEKRRLDLYERTNEVRAGRDWWSLQPVRRPSIPNEFGRRPKPTLHNPIDAFVYRQHVKNGLQFSPAADPRILFRRLHFDAIGLPPAFDQSQAFISSKDPDAYIKQVDQLLASPRFGEHHARDWLDLVRYADTNGYERDAEKKNSWKYRDWVVDSFNQDKPFDQFVLQQVAGDQLRPLREENVVGTTMLRVGTWDDEPNDKLEYKYDRLEDLIHVTSTAFLGLTVKCARCHNHKFDPIPQIDYYRIGSIFWPGDLIGNKDGKVKGYEVFAWTDNDTQVDPIRLLRKGNPRQPTESLAPGFLSALPELNLPYGPANTNGKDTGRRLEFARRLIDKRNPLVARVVVNRIWQHYFGYGIVRTPNNFGFKGDLPTHPELLDWLAAELLDSDWNLKRIHRLILTSRTYRQSSGVQMGRPKSNALSTEVESIDPLNLFLSRMNRKRLQSEAIRDSLLFHSNELNLEMTGRGFMPAVSAEALEGLSKGSNAWEESPPGQQARRGIYLFAKRSLIPPLMATFDAADNTRPCGKRDLTIVAPQALALLNNRFLHEQSVAFARDLKRKTNHSRGQIELAWQRVFLRHPTAGEMEVAIRHMEQQALHFMQKKQLAEKDRTKTKSRFPTNDLVLHLDANKGVETDPDQRVVKWKDSRGQVEAFGAIDTASRPRLMESHFDQRPVVRFDGKRQFLQLNKQLLSSNEFTILIVGHDQNSSGNREFLSNWNANGNSTSSVFLGLTDGRRVRFSDQFHSSKTVVAKPFLLTAISDRVAARIYSGNQLLGSKPGGLIGRNFTTPYVLGTQGNFGHEYLDGWIAELLVYDRKLNKQELQELWRLLGIKYPSLKTSIADVDPLANLEPDVLALASLCQVLLNTNEAIFVD